MYSDRRCKEKNTIKYETSKHLPQKEQREKKKGWGKRPDKDDFCRIGHVAQVSLNRTGSDDEDVR